MANKAKTDYVIGNDGTTVVGVEFTFENGKVHRIMLADLSPAVLAHAAANGIREGTRDTYSGADSADEAEASFLKRRDTMVGPNGVYASRGGARLDWVGDILDAVAALMPDLTEDRRAALKADLDGRMATKGIDGVKTWLADKKRKPLASKVDAMRKARAAEKANARISTTTDDDILA